MLQTLIKNHSFHVALLVTALLGSLFVASPLFHFVLTIEEPAVKDREFAHVEIGGTQVIAEVARTDADRQKGLSGRGALRFENGMLFVFDGHGYPAIWMKDMQFPIDIVWISGNRIVDFEENAPVPPAGASDTELPSYRPDGSANLVLEVQAGFIKENNVRIGDTVAITSQKDIEEALRKRFVENRKEELRLVRSVIAKEGLTIESLRKRKYNGSDLKIVKTISENPAYTKYQIQYRSDGLSISGVMNVPKAGKAPYPVLILNHGYIPPEKYTVGRGSRREQDYFSRRGYVTIHPDFRGYGESSPDPAARYDFNVGYTIDVMNLVEAVKKYEGGILDASRIGMWGHSMGGGVTERIMVLRNDIKAFVLFAPISSDISDNLYLVQGKITDIEKDYGITPETRKLLSDSSPYYFLSSVTAPAMIHHGTKDAIVPIEYSKKLSRSLLRNRKTALLYTYEGEQHEFIKAWPLVMTRSQNFFDQYVKFPKKR